MTRRAIEEQVRAGAEVLSDGLIRWVDPISHIAGRMDGVEIHGLLRYFDTNCYYRQPVLRARPRHVRPIVLDEYLFARNTLGLMPTTKDMAGRLTIRPVLTGPYTLAKCSLSHIREFVPLEDRALAFAEALAEEIKALAQAGATWIQIDEPAVIKYPSDFPIFRSAFERLTVGRDKPALVGRKIHVALCVYFHDCVPLYEKLADLPVDLLGMDFTYNFKLVDVVASAGSRVALGLGLVDARNTKLEDPETVARQIERMLPKIAGERACLGPSAGLEFLPRDRAFAKLELMTRIRQAVTGERATAGARR